MEKDIPLRLKKLSEEFYNGNDSAMARALDTTPQNIYRYIKNNRTPSMTFLVQLARKGINIHWFVTGEGSMRVDARGKNDGSGYYGKDKSVGKMINLIIQRLDEADYGKQVKLDILKETLDRIGIEQNTHFVEEELRDQD